MATSYASIGDYDRRVAVKRNKAARSANADGQRPEDAETFCTRWCKIRPVSGREALQNQQTQADVTHRVRMHSDTQTRQITPAMWLVTGDAERLNIVRVFDPDGRRIEIELECVERQ